MGGRSRGCRTCRRRRVKCDLTKPICTRCRVGQFVCHGYEPYAEFVDETGRFHGEKQADQSKMTAISLTMVPTVTHDEKAMIYLLDNIYSSNGSFRHLGWMATVLRHPSTPEPLSWSVYALASVFFGRAKLQSLASQNGVNIYYKALRLVQSKVHGQASIADQDLPLSVLCLCVYELVAPTSPGAWLNHATGLGMIMELGGPEEYAFGYRRETLHALRYIVILGCLHQRSRCFLEAPAWRTVPWGGDMARKTLLDSLHDIFCDIPGLLSDLQQLKSELLGKCAGNSLYARVPSTIESLYRWRWDWHTRYGSCVAVTESQFDNKPPALTALQFPNLQRAAELCLYNALLLILLRIADSLGIPATTTTNNTLSPIPHHDTLLPGQPYSPRLIAEEIVRIAPFMSESQHGNKGVYLLSFPLRIAHSRLQTLELCDWVEKKLASSNWKFDIDEL